MMSKQRMIELLEIEHECMMRKSHNDCDSVCQNCELVQDDKDLHEMYTNIIMLLKAQEPEAMDAPKPDSDIGCWYDITHNYTLEQVVSALKAQEPITGETSDGYHTFNELYHHRAVLFSVIVANYPDRAWKSRKHHDGTMYDNMFIVGIDTPDGQATYHYDVDPYWDMFKCSVLDNAPEWDGHTPAQAIKRIGKLKAQKSMKSNYEYQCNKCKFYEGVYYVQGHAPCSFWNIGGVMWNDYCSRFSQFTKKG